MKFNLVIVLFFTLILASCRKDSNILPELQGCSYIQNTDLFYCPECFMPYKQYEAGVVIRNTDSYNSFGDSLNSHAKFLQVDCDTTTLIPIDFTKYTLIGIFSSFGACDVITRKIQSDSTTQNIIYTITIKKHRGECTLNLLISMNFALIPKLPDNWNVVFDVKSE